MEKAEQAVESQEEEEEEEALDWVNFTDDETPVAAGGG